MKIEDSKPVGRRAEVRANGYGRSTAPAAPAAATADSVSVLGIPEAELTPKVRAALMSLMDEVARLRAELDHSRRRFAELEEDANRDPLVPVLNRRAFVREMGRVIAFGGRYQIAASLVYFDLNDFKALNDTHGHAAGDAALVHVGQLLTSHVRSSDLVGRLGGDEFGVILASGGEDVAQKKAQSLAGLLEETAFTWEGRRIALSAAFGVYTFKPGEDVSAAMASADTAMFARKRTMKGL